MFKQIIFPICVLLTFIASVRSQKESTFNNENIFSNPTSYNDVPLTIIIFIWLAELFPQHLQLYAKYQCKQGHQFWVVKTPPPLAHTHTHN